MRVFPASFQDQTRPPKKMSSPRNTQTEGREGGMEDNPMLEHKPMPTNIDSYPLLYRLSEKKMYSNDLQQV